MNNAQHITMCALFLCNGLADLAVSIGSYDEEQPHCPTNIFCRTILDKKYFKQYP